MFTTMFVPIKKLKVLRAIVYLIAVDVMDRFIALKGAAQLLLHYPAVFQNVALDGIRVARHPKKDVTAIGGVTSLTSFDASGSVPYKKSVSAKAPRGGLSWLATSALAALGAYIRVASKSLITTRRPIGGSPRVMPLAILSSGGHGLIAPASATHRLSITGFGGDYYR